MSERLTTFVIGDPHITEDSIPEITQIFNEIIGIVGTAKMTNLVILGDFFDSLKTPTNKELVFGTELLRRISNYFNHITIIRGNHGDMGTHNNVDYLKSMDAYGIFVANSYESDILRCYHASTQYSDMAMGSTKYSKWHLDLDAIRAEFDGWILLGHQHQYQILDDKALHIGALRRQTFAEVGQDRLLIEITPDGDAFKHYLTTPIKLVDVRTIEELLDLGGVPNTRVRFVFDDYEYYKANIDAVNSNSKGFVGFKKQLKFTKPTNKVVLAATKQTNIKSVLNSWVRTVKSDKSRAIIDKVLSSKGLQ